MRTSDASIHLGVKSLEQSLHWGVWCLRIPMEPFQTGPSLTRSDPALMDSITRPLYYITSPFTNLKQLRARLGLRPCQGGETLTRSSQRVKDGIKKKKEKTSERQAGLLEVFEKMERAGGRGGEEGEKRENRKSISRGSRRMKIEGWCGWDLGAGEEEEEVAFERLRSSLRHWRWWPWLKTYRWTRCETVGRDGGSQRRPARRLRQLLTSDIETCPFPPSSDLKTRLRNSRQWHSIHLVVREEEEINHFVNGLFFSRW